ncbi:MAG: hypothetical protein RLZ44_137, partial [Pseudomonadota bacterium]
MTERVTVGGLQVAKILYDLVREEIAPGTGMDPDAFWRACGEIVRDLAPRNRALLAKRDALQAQIDDWHRKRHGLEHNPDEYKEFLQQIGYLLPEG